MHASAGGKGTFASQLHPGVALATSATPCSRAKAFASALPAITRPQLTAAVPRHAGARRCRR